MINFKIINFFVTIININLTFLNLYINIINIFINYINTEVNNEENSDSLPGLQLYAGDYRIKMSQMQHDNSGRIPYKQTSFSL